jgi:Spy/CpxP family protein refolding chaperone
MRTLTALIVASIGVFVLAGQAMGQAPQTQPAEQGQWGHHKGWHHGPGGMFQSLNLTADQKTQVKAIMDQARTDAQNAADPQAKHQVFATAFEKVKTTVLTADQVKQLEAEKAVRHGGQCGKVGTNAPATAPAS